MFSLFLLFITGLPVIPFTELQALPPGQVTRNRVARRPCYFFVRNSVIRSFSRSAQ